MNYDKPLLYSKTVLGLLTVITAHVVQVALPDLGIAAPAWLAGGGLSVLSGLQWAGAALAGIGARMAIGQAINAAAAKG